MRASPALRLMVIALAAGLLMFAVAGCSDSNSDSNGTNTPGTNGEQAPGVSDTEVKLGTHTSLTGPIAAYNVIPRFTLAYFNHINDTEGGVNGRRITYIQKDDQYSPAQAVDLTRQLVEQDKIFAMFNALGTPNHLQVVDYLQERGVPDMYVATGASEWVKDPSQRPLVFGSNPNYQGEGVAIGKYLAEHFAGKKVGVVYQNDDFGQDGLAGLKNGIGDSLQVAGEEPYEVTDPDINSQVDRLKSAGADVVAFWVTPLLLGNGIKHARADLNWDAPFFISSVSMNELTAAIAGPAGCGLTADMQGCYIEGTMGPVATYTAQQTDIPGVATHLDVVGQTDLGGASVLTLYAQYVAEIMVETLKRAEEPLTRDSLVKAAESLKDWKCSVCLFSGNLSEDDHDPGQSIAMGTYGGGQVKITDVGYTWEGIKIADLSPDTVTSIAVPADAVNATTP